MKLRVRGKNNDEPNSWRNNQSPSKLIDYTLANRPIFSFSSKLYDSERFLRFYNGIYDNLDSIDLSQFNIVNVANQFLNLYYINQ